MKTVIMIMMMIMIEETRPTPAFYLIETKDSSTDTAVQNPEPEAEKSDSLEAKPRNFV